MLHCTSLDVEDSEIGRWHSLADKIDHRRSAGRRGVET